MILSGSLKAIKVVDLVKDAQRESFTGVITLKGKTGLASIGFKGGKVVNIREPRVRSRLGRYLVGRNIITEKELQAALQTQRSKGGFLGEILIAQAVIEQGILQSAMKAVLEESLVHLLNWNEGLFRAEATTEVQGEPIDCAPIDELANRAHQLFQAVEEDWDINDIIPGRENLQDGIKNEILQATRRVSTKLRELKPKEVVLLVEDEALMREMFKDKLISFGFEVDAVESPHKALDKLADYDAEGKIPIVVSDLIMPTISGKGLFGGLELLEEIQKTYSHVPVLVNTAYPDPTIRRRALFLGATYYINKPERREIGPDKLESQLNLFIEEVALCIQNVIQRHEVLFERDQQNILREELLSQLILSREELQKVGEVVRRDSGDMRFLCETSHRMVRDKSLGKMAETIVTFAAREVDRSAIFLVRKDAVTGFFGGDRRPEGQGFNDRIRGLAFNLEDSPLLSEAATGRKTISRESPGQALGSKLLSVLTPPPQQAIALPIMVQGVVAAILYGDVVPGGMPPRDIDSLEVLLNLASMSLEIQHQQAVIQRLRQMR